MLRFTFLLGALLWAAPPLMAADRVAYDTVEAASKDPDFKIQGEYAIEGQGVQVIALGEGKFRAVKYTGGLPGAGWDKKSKSAEEGDAAKIAEITKSLKKMDRTSPTLGAKPPAGAVVLFDGTEDALKAHWKPGARINEAGLLTQGCTTTDLMQDFSIHFEFQLPFMPNSRGQGRANSGVYLQGRYEVQILDSFGLDGLNNECGGVYTVVQPDVNMCLPPLVWQSYDVDFTAARFEGDKKVKNARMLFKHNGVVIHDREIERMTPGGPLSSESAAPGPLYLQDHGDPVRYRNIWFVKK
ncbi:MAG: DUF1080 domain-containing protein [Planctomycetota bacterium]|nr:MAG: DUF1080 domain-containing protein [Planctomycetota bacterium]